MKINLEKVGKKYGRNWIFRDLTLEIPENISWAITGHNGSGKSTLLQIISSFSDPTIGKITYNNSEPIHQISYAAPYLELIEELTLLEHLQFHFTFKKPTMQFDEMISRAGLIGSEDKIISEFSSGMKQRLKLILAFFSETSLLCLDEPTSNLDEAGIEWYHQEIIKQNNTRTILIASNQRFEFDFCEEKISIEKYKPVDKRAG